jgi:hypothetical protein
MHIMFGSAHVTGATASTPTNLSDDSSDDEEVCDVEDDVKLATLHKNKHKKHKTPSTIVIEDKKEKSFVVAGWPGSAHDTRILNHALTNFGDKFPKPSPDKYYLVDSGYPNRIGYLAPFKGSTYHILEFHLQRQRPPQGKYEKFNYLHSSLRNVIERSFGVLKQNWRILKSMQSFSPHRQKHIIIACMDLHNFICDISLRDEDFGKCDEDENYMPQDEDDEGQEVAQPIDDDILEEDNEVSMNTIRDNISNTLVSG